jgi:NADPH:quinone reductase-like Zn-dependent oxidoreductase
MEEPTFPSDMRAWIHTRRGPPSTVLTLSKTVKTPTLTSPNAVLIRVSHAALNPGGSIFMQLCPFIFRASPAIPELDFSGTIAGLGSDVPSSRNLNLGTAIFGSVPVSAHVGSSSGALAEYVVVPAHHVVAKPETAGFEDVAGLPVAGSTALAVIEKAELKKGDSVLINGASGGIGSMVVQMVRDVVGESGRVVAICSGKNVEMVKKLGANEVSFFRLCFSLECRLMLSYVSLPFVKTNLTFLTQVINYQEHEPVTQYLTANYSNPRFDIIIDAYGAQELYNHSPAYLKEGGPFVAVGVAFKYTFSSMLYAALLMLKNNFWPRILGGVPRYYVGPTGIATLESMEKLKKLMEDGKLRAVIDSTWDMEDVQQVRIRSHEQNF